MDTLNITQVATPLEALLALPFLRSIDSYYPKIADWYVNTVVPGIVQNDDVVLLARSGGNVVGAALGKSGTERKLRCVRVASSFAGSGLGIRLIDRVIDHIGPKPMCSVSEELLHHYSRIFIKRYGFELGDVAKGAYRRGKLEYFFNGSYSAA